jgi:3-hydroxyisobutyrate dehydrogenase
MARNLLAAGFTLRAWNRSIERAHPLEADGATVVDDPATAAEDCSLMITMLSDADAVLDVAAPALSQVAPDATWIQMSTIGIGGTERCAALAQRTGLKFVDAPVLGTRAPAEQGKLVVLASGPEGSRDACRPVFDAVGSRTMWVGEAGASTRLKVVINGWIVGLVSVLAETITLAEALDVDPTMFFEAIDGGPLDLPYARVKGGAMIDKSFDDASFRLALARKDADLLLAAAADRGLEVPVLAAVLDRLRAAEADGHGDKDMAATYWANASR